MSRATKYELTFLRGIKVKISLYKTYGESTDLHRGKSGRLLRQINVLAVDDATPLSKDDIEQVVPWSDIESYYSYRDDDGMTHLLRVDKNLLKSVYKNSDCMSVIGVIPMSEIRSFVFDGYHYFISVQRDKKTKAMNPADQKVYTIIHDWLYQKAKILLVKYISSNREKFALISADAAGLTLSNIIHSTYQRERPTTDLIVIPDSVSYGDKLFSGLDMRTLKPENIVDTFEQDLRDYIDRAKTEPATEDNRPKLRLKIRTAEIDILDQIMALP